MLLCSRSRSRSRSRGRRLGVDAFRCHEIAHSAIH